MPWKQTVCLVPQRWIVCALCSLTLAFITCKNTCYSAIADIVYTVTERFPHPPEGEGCPYTYSGTVWEQKSLPFALPNIYWNKHIESISDACFLTGTLLMAVPAGVLSDLGFSRWILGGGLLLVATTQFTRPALLALGVYGKAVQTLFEGAGDAALLPSIVSLTARWCPPWQRNTFTAFVLAGMFYGDSLGRLFYSLIFLGTSSWEYGYYITGIIGLVLSILCLTFIHHSPEESPFISQHEYQTITFAHRRSSRLRHLYAIPWCKIATSRAFLSLVLLFCAVDWASDLNSYANLYSYQAFILHVPENFVNVSTSAMVVALPSMIMGGFISDWVIKRNLTTKTKVKIRFVCISILPSTIFLLTAACFAGCNMYFLWILTIVGIYLSGWAYPVVFCAPVDMSQRHAGLMTGIMLAVKTVCVLFTQRLDEFLVPYIYSVWQWRVRAMVCALLTLLLMVPFMLYGSLEKQHWIRRRAMTSPNVSSRLDQEDLQTDVDFIKSTGRPTNDAH